VHWQFEASGHYGKQIAAIESAFNRCTDDVTLDAMAERDPALKALIPLAFTAWLHKALKNRDAMQRLLQLAVPFVQVETGVNDGSILISKDRAQKKGIDY
jgi:hypothetical protein